MSISLYEFFKKEIKKMVNSLGQHEKGNIHPLIMNEIERYVISLVLEETNYNFLKTTRALGIGRSTLYRRVKALGISTKKSIKSQ